MAVAHICGCQRAVGDDASGFSDCEMCQIVFSSASPLQTGLGFCIFSSSPTRLNSSCDSQITTTRSLLESFRLMIADFCRIVFKQKTTVFLLLIIFNLFLTEASPTHRGRHHHHDHDLTKVPRCEEVQEKPRCRRDVSYTMTLKEGENSTHCPNVVCMDEDLNRRPERIYQVVCLQCGSRCTERGDYRCTQLYNNMEVWYVKNDTHATHSEEWTDRKGSLAMTQGKYRVNYGCVCAISSGRHADVHNHIAEHQ